MLISNLVYKLNEIRETSGDLHVTFCHYMMDKEAQISEITIQSDCYAVYGTKYVLLGGNF